MKKLLVLGAILLFSVMSYGQGVSIHYGMSETVTVEVSNELNGNLIGVGGSFYMGNPNIASYMPINTPTPTDLYFKGSFRTPRNAMFMVIGHQGDNLSFLMRLGAQNSYNYTTFTNNTSCFYYRNTTPYDLLVGVELAYKVEDDFAFNVGYDNFNDITLGFTIYWGKSHHTNHMCKPKTI